MVNAPSAAITNAMDERQVARDVSRARSYGEQQGKERRWLDRRVVQDFDTGRGAVHQAVDKASPVQERTLAGVSGNHERNQSGSSGSYERQRVGHPSRPDQKTSSKVRPKAEEIKDQRAPGADMKRRRMSTNPDHRPFKQDTRY